MAGAAEENFLVRSESADGRQRRLGPVTVMVRVRSKRKGWIGREAIREREKMRMAKRTGEQSWQTDHWPETVAIRVWSKRKGWVRRETIRERRFFFQVSFWFYNFGQILI